MYKLITSSRGSDDLSIGFDRDRNRRQREFTKNKKQKSKFHLRIYLMDNFGFAEHQKMHTYRLRYTLTSTTNSDNSALNKANATIVGKIKVNSIEWYMPLYIGSISQQAILSKQISIKAPTELQYVERSVFMKEVNTQNIWTSELRTQDVVNVPIRMIVGFQQRDSQKFNNDTFYRPPVTRTQTIIGTKKYAESDILLNYNDEYFSQGYSQIKEAFRALTKDDIIKP